MSAALDAFMAEPAKPEHWPEQLRSHLSASSLGTFARCPELYRRRYLKGEKERPGAALVWGSADHYAHEQNFRQKIDSHEDISESDLRLAFAEGFDRSVERDGGESEVAWGENKPGDLKDKGVEVASLYHRLVSPSVQPIAVEEKIRVDVSGLAVPIIGRIDVVTDFSVIERKTASRAKKAPEPHWLTQGRIYQAATRKPVSWHISAKTKVPGVYTPEQEPGLMLPYSGEAVAATEERVRRMVSVLLHLLATFGPDEPWPTSAPDYGWQCNFCGFRDSCAWWAGT